ILAYATGEESFDDVNGNGIFDNGDIFTQYDSADPPSVSRDNFFGLPFPAILPVPPLLRQPPQDDIGEIYLDANQNGQYDSGESYFDYNNDGTRNAPDGDFHGVGCNPANTPPGVGCGGNKFGVGLQACIIMSTSEVNIS